MSFISLFTMTFIKNPFNIFINYIMTILLACLIFKPTIIKGLICSVLSLFILNLIGILIINPYITIFNIDSNTLNTVPIYRIGYIFTVYFLAFIIVLILKYKNLNLDLSDDEIIDKKNRIIIILNLSFGIFSYYFTICYFILLC